MTTEADS